MSKLSATAFLLLSTAIGAGATEPRGPHPLDQPSYDAPARPWTDVAEAERDRRCRDRIEQVRQAAGKPELDRETAEPDNPLLMHAVDHRIDGCGVLVPVSDPSDIRQVPAPGKPELKPAKP